MTKSKYHHGNLREKLLQTALEIVSEEGLAKVSMRKLGEKIGVSRSAPYRHFKGKGELLSAIAEDGFRKLTNSLNSVRNKKSGNPVTQFKNIGIAYIEFALEHPVQYRLMFGHEIIEQDQTPELIKAAEGAFSELLLGVGDLLKDDLIKPMDPLIIANTLWSQTHGISTLLMDGQINRSNSFLELPAILIREKNKSKINVPKIIDHVAEVVLYGILK
ncbi:MAG: TetR/AcrR family transcriptional regulator [Desulfobacteraceae bacterium]|nr:TetR/AcrR family transcriptional regulator [Desulfobacteraceae bacterium]